MDERQGVTWCGVSPEGMDRGLLDVRSVLMAWTRDRGSLGRLLDVRSLVSPVGIDKTALTREALMEGLTWTREREGN